MPLVTSDGLEKMRTRLQRYYAYYNPSKIDSIDDILRLYEYDESAMFADLTEIYGAEHQQTETVSAVVQKAREDTKKGAQPKAHAVIDVDGEEVGEEKPKQEQENVGADVLLPPSSSLASFPLPPQAQQMPFVTDGVGSGRLGNSSEEVGTRGAGGGGGGGAAARVASLLSGLALRGGGVAAASSALSSRRTSIRGIGGGGGADFPPTPASSALDIVISAATTPTTSGFFINHMGVGGGAPQEEKQQTETQEGPPKVATSDLLLTEAVGNDGQEKIESQHGTTQSPFTPSPAATPTSLANTRAGIHYPSQHSSSAFGANTNNNTNNMTGTTTTTPPNINETPEERKKRLYEIAKKELLATEESIRAKRGILSLPQSQPEHMQSTPTRISTSNYAAFSPQPMFAETVSTNMSTHTNIVGNNSDNNSTRNDTDAAHHTTNELLLSRQQGYEAVSATNSGSGLGVGGSSSNGNGVSLSPLTASEASVSLTPQSSSALHLQHQYAPQYARQLSLSDGNGGIQHSSYRGGRGGGYANSNEGNEAMALATLTASNGARSKPTTANNNTSAYNANPQQNDAKGNATTIMNKEAVSVTTTTTSTNGGGGGVEVALTDTFDELERLANKAEDSDEEKDEEDRGRDRSQEGSGSSVDGNNRSNNAQRRRRGSDAMSEGSRSRSSSTNFDFTSFGGVRGDWRGEEAHHGGFFSNRKNTRSTEGYEANPEKGKGEGFVSSPFREKGNRRETQKGAERLASELQRSQKKEMERQQKMAALEEEKKKKEEEEKKRKEELARQRSAPSREVVGSPTRKVSFAHDFPKQGDAKSKNTSENTRNATDLGLSSPTTVSPAEKKRKFSDEPSTSDSESDVEGSSDRDGAHRVEEEEEKNGGLFFTTASSSLFPSSSSPFNRPSFSGRRIGANNNVFVKRESSDAGGSSSDSSVGDNVVAVVEAGARHGKPSSPTSVSNERKDADKHETTTALDDGFDRRGEHITSPSSSSNSSSSYSNLSSSASEIMRRLNANDTYAKAKAKKKRREENSKAKGNTTDRRSDNNDNEEKAMGDKENETLPLDPDGFDGDAFYHESSPTANDRRKRRLFRRDNSDDEDDDEGDSMEDFKNDPYGTERRRINTDEKSTTTSSSIESRSSSPNDDYAGEQEGEDDSHSYSNSAPNGYSSSLHNNGSNSVANEEMFLKSISDRSEKGKDKRDGVNQRGPRDNDVDEGDEKDRGSRRNGPKQEEEVRKSKKPSGGRRAKEGEVSCGGSRANTAKHGMVIITNEDHEKYDPFGMPLEAGYSSNSGGDDDDEMQRTRAGDEPITQSFFLVPQNTTNNSSPSKPNVVASNEDRSLFVVHAEKHQRQGQQQSQEGHNSPNDEAGGGGEGDRGEGTEQERRSVLGTRGASREFDTTHSRKAEMTTEEVSSSPAHHMREGDGHLVAGREIQEGPHDKQLGQYYAASVGVGLGAGGSATDSSKVGRWGKESQNESHHPHQQHQLPSHGYDEGSVHWAALRANINTSTSPSSRHHSPQPSHPPPPTVHHTVVVDPYSTFDIPRPKPFANRNNNTNNNDGAVYASWREEEGASEDAAAPPPFSSLPPSSPSNRFDTAAQAQTTPSHRFNPPAEKGGVGGAAHNERERLLWRNDTSLHKRSVEKGEWERNTTRTHQKDGVDRDRDEGKERKKSLFDRLLVPSPNRAKGKEAKSAMAMTGPPTSWSDMRHSRNAAAFHNSSVMSSYHHAYAHDHRDREPDIPAATSFFSSSPSHPPPTTASVAVPALAATTPASALSAAHRTYSYRDEAAERRREEEEALRRAQDVINASNSRGKALAYSSAKPLSSSTAAANNGREGRDGDQLQLEDGEEAQVGEEAQMKMTRANSTVLAAGKRAPFSNSSGGGQQSFRFASNVENGGNELDDGVASTVFELPHRNLLNPPPPPFHGNGKQIGGRTLSPSPRVGGGVRGGDSGSEVQKMRNPYEREGDADTEMREGRQSRFEEGTDRDRPITVREVPALLTPSKTTDKLVARTTCVVYNNQTAMVAAAAGKEIVQRAVMEAERKVPNNIVTDSTALGSPRRQFLLMNQKDSRGGALGPQIKKDEHHPTYGRDDIDGDDDRKIPRGELQGDRGDKKKSWGLSPHQRREDGDAISLAMGNGMRRLHRRTPNTNGPQEPFISFSGPVGALHHQQRTIAAAATRGGLYLTEDDVFRDHYTPQSFAPVAVLDPTIKSFVPYNADKGLSSYLAGATTAMSTASTSHAHRRGEGEGGGGKSHVHGQASSDYGYAMVGSDIIAGNEEEYFGPRDSFLKASASDHRKHSDANGDGDFSKRDEYWYGRDAHREDLPSAPPPNTSAPAFVAEGGDVSNAALYPTVYYENVRVRVPIAVVAESGNTSNDNTDGNRHRRGPLHRDGARRANVAMVEVLVPPAAKKRLGENAGENAPIHVEGGEWEEDPAEKRERLQRQLAKALGHDDNNGKHARNAQKELGGDVDDAATTVNSVNSRLTSTTATTTLTSLEGPKLIQCVYTKPPSSSSRPLVQQTVARRRTPHQYSSSGHLREDEEEEKENEKERRGGGGGETENMLTGLLIGASPLLARMKESEEADLRQRKIEAFARQKIAEEQQRARGVVGAQYDGNGDVNHFRRNAAPASAHVGIIKRNDANFPASAPPTTTMPAASASAAAVPRGFVAESVRVLSSSQRPSSPAVGAAHSRLSAHTPPKSHVHPPQQCFLHNPQQYEPLKREQRNSAATGAVPVPLSPFLSRTVDAVGTVAIHAPQSSRALRHPSSGINTSGGVMKSSSTKRPLPPPPFTTEQTEALQRQQISSSSRSGTPLGVAVGVGDASAPIHVKRGETLPSSSRRRDEAVAPLSERPAWLVNALAKREKDQRTPIQ